MHRQAWAVGTALAVGAAMMAPPCRAQDYPSRPIRFIVGFVPGGIADLLARALAQKLTDAWGQQVVVDNRAGGSGLIGMQLAARAAADGYTLLLGSSTQFSINPALRADLPYDPLRDYTAITLLAVAPVLLTVQTAGPRSLPELIQLAKREKLSYGSTGYGGAPHIAAELLKRQAGIDMTHIPFKGGGDSMIALLGGHVQAAFGAVSTAQPHMRGGRLRALGVTTAVRLPAIAEVPTFAEQGLPGFEVVQWYGVFAPAGLSPPLLRKLNDALVRSLGTADFHSRFEPQGVELKPSTPAALNAYVRDELRRWTSLLKDMGIHDAP